MSEPWLSAEEIAAHLGVTKDTVYVWIADKAMPAHKVGRLWKFQATEVDAWVRGWWGGESDGLRASSPSGGAPGGPTAIRIAPAPRDDPGRASTRLRRVTVTYQDGDGGLGQRLLYRTDEPSLSIEAPTSRWRSAPTRQSSA